MFLERTLAQVFPEEFSKFLRTYFFINHIWWLLLYQTKFYMYMSCAQKAMMASPTQINRHIGELEYIRDTKFSIDVFMLFTWCCKVVSLKLLPLLTLTFKNNFVICFIERPLKMMKNAFGFILRALFILKIFNYLSWLFCHVGKTAWLGR